MDSTADVHPTSWVKPGAWIGPNASIGANVLVESTAIVKADTILCDHVHVHYGQVVSGHREWLPSAEPQGSLPLHI